MSNLDSSGVPDYAKALRLDGRGVVVVGGGQGIGRQTSHALAALGAKVFCIDNDADRAHAVAREVSGVAGVGDATQREEMERLFAEAQTALGRIDGLADILGVPAYGPILDLDDASWDRQHDITLRQAYYALQIGARAMITSGGGAMVFVSSVSGLTSAPHHAAYGAAKAGLTSLVKSAAIELARHKIRVNAVAPGLTWTPRIAASMGPAERERAEANVPLRRVGAPSDIASAILFFLSDLAGYVTGQTLVVDGGATASFPLAMKPPRNPAGPTPA
jgi:NAD(P)-dependent dehydrogenase (short-subunit alcohol dehydrogenase family)